MLSNTKRVSWFLTHILCLHVTQNVVFQTKELLVNILALCSEMQPCTENLIRYWACFLSPPHLSLFRCVTSAVCGQFVLVFIFKYKKCFDCYLCLANIINSFESPFACTCSRRNFSNNKIIIVIVVVVVVEVSRITGGVARAAATNIID